MKVRPNAGIALYDVGNVILLPALVISVKPDVRIALYDFGNMILLPALPVSVKPMLG